MRTAVPKQYMMLGDGPLMVHALRVFDRTASVAEVILVVPKEQQARTLSEVVERFGIRKVHKVVAGGVTRQESVYHGLKETDPETEIVVVHDAVRPFVTEDIIERSIEIARKSGGAVVAVPMKETVKQVSAEGQIQRTLDRSHFWLAQTPQTFRRALLLEAYRKAECDRFHATDDAMLVERLGQKVAVVQGRWDNIKITSPEDMEMAEAILAGRLASVHHESVRA